MKQLLNRIKNNYTNNRKEFVRTLLISEGFGFCFSLSCVLGYELDNRGTVCSSVGNVLVNIVASLVLGFAIAAILVLLQEYASANTYAMEEADRVDIKVWVAVAILLLILWLPILLAYYPAIFSYDAEAQLYQVISGNYTTHHPLLHTLFMGACMKVGFTDHGIGLGMTLYAVIQMLIMATILGWTVDELKRIGVKKPVYIIYTLFLGLFPAHGILAISTTKDVVFSGLVVMFTLLLRRVLAGARDNQKSNTADLIKLVITSICMMLLRNNAGYAYVVVVIILAIVAFFRRKRENRRWSLIIAMALAFVISTVAGAGLKSITRAESGSPREALSIPIQQMARVKVLCAESLTSEERGALDSLIDDEAASKYDAHLADPVKERISMKQPALFVKTWIKLGIKYLGEYLDAWLYTTEGAWYIRDKSCNRIYGEGQITGFGYLSTDIRNMPEGFEVHNESILPGLRSVLERIVSDNSFEDIPVIRLIFSPAVYLWIFLLFMYSSVVKRNERNVILALFALMYFFTIMLSPAILVRYMYPYMLLVFLPGMPDALGDGNDCC